VEDAARETEVLDFSLPQGGRPAAGQQGEQVELAPDGGPQPPGLLKPGRQVKSAHSCVAALFFVPVDAEVGVSAGSSRALRRAWL
jgi:hypothetical protein